MKIARILPAGALFGLLIAGCATPDEGATIQPSGFSADAKSPETPPPARVASLLQEAKQQYDDRHYERAFKDARNAERLIQENELSEADQSTAVAIQGFSLLQLGLVDDYAVKTFGRQEGAITLFERALALTPDTFPHDRRARLGLGLALFRRHGESIRKADSIDQGILLLIQVREDLRRALAGGQDDAMRLREATRKHTLFSTNRAKLIKLGYVFQDPASMKMDPATGHREDAPWLGGVTQANEELAVQDIGWALDDANKGDKVEPGDRDKALNAASSLADSWRKVRHYWRVNALKDLQAARDRLLAIREKWPAYFWVERDLTFVYQSIGGYFMDAGLEQARLKAVAAGALDDTLEQEAQRIYASDSFKPPEKLESKLESKKNYKVALDFALSFVEKHQVFEGRRKEKRDAADYSDINENPFLVDLVQRYHDTMDQLIAEERDMRMNMILEAAALCVDPLFQQNDHALALVLANNLKALAPDNPIHDFVRATANFAKKDYAAARDSYTAFIKASSVLGDHPQRKVAYLRIEQCDDELRRSAGAGGNG